MERGQICMHGRVYYHRPERKPGIKTVGKIKEGVKKTNASPCCFV
jgi:hypothetical protein